MNKGRNIALVFLCMLCVSVLAFLTTLNRDNHSGVVDDVRYYLTDTQEDTKSYDFYFVEKDKKMSGLLYTDPEASVYTVTVIDYPFTYTVQGEQKKNTQVSYTVTDPEAAQELDPYGTFTEDFFKAMIYGAAPVLTVTEAIIVAFIGAVGGLVIGRAEELWGYFNKDSDKEYPEWKELGKYRRTGGGIIAFAVVLLLCLILF